MENANQKRIRVMLVDDEPLVLHSLGRLLDHRPDIEVIAQAVDGAGAVELAVKLKPEVILMDVVMKPMDGIEATKQIVSFAPEVKILGLSSHSAGRYVGGIIKAGASGYLLKGGPIQELLRAIHEVAAKGKYLGPGLENGIFDILQQDAKGNPALIESLSEREREVLRLAGMGRSTKQIAEELQISARTVDNHRATIMHKIGAKTTADLIRFAIKQGIAVL